MVLKDHCAGCPIFGTYRYFNIILKKIIVSHLKQNLFNLTKHLSEDIQKRNKIMKN